MCSTCDLQDDLAQSNFEILARITGLAISGLARDGRAGDSVSSLRDATHNEALLAVRCYLQVETETLPPTESSPDVPKKA